MGIYRSDFRLNFFVLDKGFEFANTVHFDLILTKAKKTRSPEPQILILLKAYLTFFDFLLGY